MRKMNYIVFCIITSFITSSALETFNRVSYSFSHDPIDVVIPCHPDDASTLLPLVRSIKKYVKDIRRVIVVSNKSLCSEAEWFDEALFPFTKEGIAKICRSKKNTTPKVNTPSAHISKRVGWIYQQLLKFYSPLIIPNISSNVLVVDADVLFLKPVQFLQNNGAGLYATGTEYHKAYFEHTQRLLPELKKIYPKFSGITHHMLFQKEVLLDLFSLIEDHHSKRPWAAIVQTIEIDKNDYINHAAMSEYEIYFNFVFSRTNQVKLRQLKWKNISKKNEIIKCTKENYDFVAKHNYRKKPY